jgi:hypothetical protein
MNKNVSGGCARKARGSRTARGDHDPPPARQHPDQAEAGAHVPVAAAALADCLVRDSFEAVREGVLEQLLAPPPRQLLLRAELVERLARGRRGGRERITRPLELREREQGGAAAGRAAQDPAVDRCRLELRERVRPRAHDELGQLAVEPRDLVAERAPCRSAVGERRDRKQERVRAVRERHGISPRSARSG